MVVVTVRADVDKWVRDVYGNSMLEYIVGKY